MIALALALQAMPPSPPAEPPGIARLKRHLELLERVGGEALTTPLLECVRAQADGTHPDEKALGDPLAAVGAADRWVRDCRGEETRARLITALRGADGSMDADAAGVVADAGMGMTMFVTIMLANKTYKIDGAKPASGPVEIPVPRNGQADD